MQAIFQDNVSLCNEVTPSVIQHFIHCIGNDNCDTPYVTLWWWRGWSRWWSALLLHACCSIQCTAVCLLRIFSRKYRNCLHEYLGHAAWLISSCAGVDSPLFPAESHGRRRQYLKFLQAIIKSEGKGHNRRCQDMVMAELVNTQAGEEVRMMSSVCQKPLWRFMVGLSERSRCSGTSCLDVVVFKSISTELKASC